MLGQAWRRARSFNEGLGCETFLQVAGLSAITLPEVGDLSTHCVGFKVMDAGSQRQCVLKVVDCETCRMNQLPMLRDIYLRALQATGGFP